MARECDSVYTERSLLDVIRLGAEVADRRHARGIRHPLSSMLTILLIGFLLGQTTIRGICRALSCKDKLDQLGSLVGIFSGSSVRCTEPFLLYPDTRCGRSVPYRHLLC